RKRATLLISNIRLHATLFTLGYEGLTIDAFVARLQTAQVKTVVDVRELPPTCKHVARGRATLSN
ncbi:MAG: hypothetical protein R6X34_01695, partial [Chloroflexota bacterium]